MQVRYPAVFLALMVFSVVLLSREKSSVGNFSKTQPNSRLQTNLNINDFSYWVRADGLTGRNPITGGGGGFYPQIDSRWPTEVVFADGLLWSVIMRDSANPQPLRVGGQTYSVGTVPGAIISPGIAMDRNDPRLRAYRIRRDYQSLSESELKIDAALQFHNGDTSRVTSANILELRNRYALDWATWPVDLGAPFYDLNENGIYEPAQGETPGLANADMVVWLVANDLDVAATTGLYGSQPIGLEMQLTLWAYRQPQTPLGEAIFQRYRLINKSGVLLDSVYLGKWTDYDVGNFTDDFAGCDTTLDLSYCYSAFAGDDMFQQYGLAPAAAGYLLLQGPIVPAAGQIARFNFRERPNFRNLRASSCVYFPPASPIGDRCKLRNYDCTLTFTNSLRGYTQTTDIRNPWSYITGSGPDAGLPTKFPLSGDPVRGFGDLDGQGNNFPPGDRRSLLSSGPLTMMPGDTQEVVVALVGGIDPDGDNITSFAQMRRNALIIQQAYQNGFRAPRATQPQITPDFRQTRFQNEIDLGDWQTVSDVQLHFTSVDDPAGFVLNMEDAGNGRWQIDRHVENRRKAYQVELRFQSSEGMVRYPKFYSGLALRPAPLLHNWKVVWENGPQDSRINTGETVHLAFEIINRDEINPLGQLTVKTATGIEQFALAQPLAPGEARRSPRQYLQATAGRRADSLWFSFTVLADGSRYFHSNALPAFPWYPAKSRGGNIAIEEISGLANRIKATIMEPEILTGHQYEISFSNDPEDPAKLLWQLTDLTAGEIKLPPHPLAEGDFYPHPVVDGILFNVRQNPDSTFLAFETVANAAGPLDPPEGAAADFQGFPSQRPTDRQQVGEGHWMIHAADDGSAGSWEAFLDRVSRGGLNWDRIQPNDYEIRFTPGGSTAIDAFQNRAVFAVPFELWNIGNHTLDDPSDDYRMIPVVRDVDFDGEFDYIDSLDHSASSATNDPFTDWIYWYNPIDTSPGEAGYQTEAIQMQNDPASWEHNSNREVMARMVLMNWNGGETTTNGPYNQLLPEAGTIFRIRAAKPLTETSLFRLTAPMAMADSVPITLPVKPVLYQNFPNPFNNRTFIAFDINRDADVRLEIFNILGQRVRTLVDRELPLGSYRILWDGRNDAGVSLASGIYIYRLNSGRYLRVKKLALVK